jgi:hypothetical protein
MFSSRSSSGGIGFDMSVSFSEDGDRTNERKSQYAKDSTTGRKSLKANKRFPSAVDMDEDKKAIPMNALRSSLSGSGLTSTVVSTTSSSRSQSQMASKSTSQSSSSRDQQDNSTRFSMNHQRSLSSMKLHRSSSISRSDSLLDESMNADGSGSGQGRRSSLGTRSVSRKSNIQIPVEPTLAPQYQLGSFDFFDDEFHDRTSRNRNPSRSRSSAVRNDHLGGDLEDENEMTQWTENALRKGKKK